MSKPSNERELTSAQKAALVEARKLDRAVEVVSEATERSSTWARPDGTVASDLYTDVQRVKGPDGRWSWVDTSLVRHGKVFKPRAAKGDLELSAGGDQLPLATLRDTGKSFSIRWPASLPEPRVSGNVAIYANAVGPGADLVVTALSTGFTHDVVLRQRPTNTLELRFPVELSGLKLSQGGKGQLRLSDEQGRLVAAAPQPMMWDNDDLATQATAPHRAAVDTRIEQDENGSALVLRPDANFLADPKVRYPVRVDPTTTLNISTDTWVSTAFPSSQPGAVTLNAGKFANGDIARTYLKFDVSSLSDKIVDSAFLNLKVSNQGGCSTSPLGGATPVLRVRRVTQAWDPATLSYSAQPTTTDDGSAVNTTCSPMYLPVTPIVQAWLKGNQPNHGVQVRAEDESSTAAAKWATFHSTEAVTPANRPVLTVNHNTKPEVPTVTVEAVESQFGNHVVTRTSSVKTTFTARSQDGGPVDFELSIRSSTSTMPGIINIRGVPSGTPAPYTFGVKSPDSWTFTARACRTNTAGTACSAETPLYRISSDAANPPTDLATTLDEPANPVLSGVLARPSEGKVTGKFYLFDEFGAPVGPSPIGQGTVEGGDRLALRLLDNTVRPGQRYSWQMQSCVQEACTARTANVSFTVPGVPPPPPAPQTQRITLDQSKFTIKTAKVDATACAGGPCPLVGSPTVQVGGQGLEARLSVVKVDPTAIPAGATIVSATLDLGAGTCETACPVSGELTAHQLRGNHPSNPSGADIINDVFADTAGTTPINDPKLEIQGDLESWRDPEDPDLGLVLRAKDALPVMVFGGANAERAMSVTVDYVPPAAPGNVSLVTAIPGDGGALVGWTAPQNLGAAVESAQYEVQVLDSGNAVIKTVIADSARSAIPGLANGTQYKFQVRAKTSFGVGPWTVSNPVTPAAISGGSQQYIDAAQQVERSIEAIRDGVHANADTAIAANSQGKLFTAALQTMDPRLVENRVVGESHGYTRKDTVLSFSDHVVSNQGGRIIVHMVASGTTKHVDDAGTASEEVTPETFSHVKDYIFTPPASGTGSATLTQTTMEPVGLASVSLPLVGNAIATGDTDNPVLGPDQVLPVGADGWPADPAATRTLATPTYSKNAKLIADYARAGGKLPDYKNEFPNQAAPPGSTDCTNFVSKALRRGGKLKEVKPKRSVTGRDRVNNAYWFDGNPWGYRTRSFFEVKANYWHFNNSARRLQWRRSYADVQVGDIMYWQWGGGLKHMSVVTKKTGNRLDQIQYSAHTENRSDRRLTKEYTDDAQIGFARVVW
ncbi:DNRLRE domain-containing protein [Sphaerisporangium sp. NPDC051017]|uniref:DNRLRE domain-containing protein n=1 Tax=Sphaerisporangium sp. NPDC051017 TaxID=3154636 RepID=UPI0034402E5B